MPSPLPAAPPRLDLSAAGFRDLTLCFDAFFREASTEGVARLAGRRFLRCNLAGPALVSLGAGVRFADCTFSACAFTALPDARGAAPGAILVEDCVFDDCVLSRWALFLSPAPAAALLRDMPQVRIYGLRPFW